MRPRSYPLLVRLDVIDRFANGRDLFGFLVRNLLEFPFESHHELHGVEATAPRSSTKVRRH